MSTYGTRCKLRVNSQSQKKQLSLMNAHFLSLSAKWNLGYHEMNELGFWKWKYGLVKYPGLLAVIETMCKKGISNSSWISVELLKLFWIPEC